MLKMGRPLIDRTGHRVGRLSVVGRADDKVTPSGKAYARWLCRCDCGAEVKVMSGHLNEANTTSCGCAHRDIMSGLNSTHGGTGTPEHATWRHMRERCVNSRAKEYPDYGGRGIKVCERWGDFALFLSDMGPRPSPEHSIDRIDVNGNYEPSNCRWATDLEQARNRRNNIVVKVGDKSVCLKEAVQLLGGSILTYKSVHKRMAYKGMTFEAAMAATTI
jgi:hypothetical protein